MSSANEVQTTTVALPSIFFVAWVVMLVLGAIHLDLAASWPHPGYWITLLVVFAVGLVARFIGLVKN